MSGEERPKRPRLERSAPIRNWSGILGGNGTAKAPATADEPAAGADGIDDVIVRSVEVGYRVIDEYVKRGQAAAQRMQHGAYGPQDMARDAQGVAAQLVRSATDLAGAWAEFFALANRDASRADGQAPVAPAAGPTADGAPPVAPSAAPPAPSAAPAPLRVRIAVTASRPVETMLDLRPVTADRALVVHALRGAGGARLDEVGVETADGVATIAIRVPAGQPEGQYAGLVCDDASNVPVGTVTVVLPAA